MHSDIDSILQSAGVTPTSNRVLVARTLCNSDSPMSLADIEAELDTLDKSSISRVLAILCEHSIIHALEDGRGIAKYEMCHGHDHHHSQDDMHIHFYCTKCMHTYCFEDIPVPSVKVPENFKITSVNYMLKGICPLCACNK